MNSPLAKDSTLRFGVTREAIIAAGAEVLSEGSAKGLTLKAVAERVGLKTSSITYYFSRRDDLLLVCLEHTLERFSSLLDRAERQDTPELRVAAFVHDAFERMTRRVRGDEPDLASLSCIRALPEADQRLLNERFRTIFRRLRAMIEPDGADPHQRALYSAKAHAILDIVSTFYMWAASFDEDQHGRLRDRLIDIILNGIAGPASQWAPDALPPQALIDDENALTDFFRVATRMINQNGYRGASISRIAAELNRTKGSFYHHLDSKTDLVSACFQRSFATLATAYRQAASPAGPWQQLVTMVSGLIGFQFSDHGPMLSFTATGALPPEQDQEMTARAVASGRRIEGLISDAIAAGDARPVDAFVASQAVLAVINGAADFTKWSQNPAVEDAVGNYASLVFFGLSERRH